MICDWDWKFRSKFNDLWSRCQELFFISHKAIFEMIWLKSRQFLFLSFTLSESWMSVFRCFAIQFKMDDFVEEEVGRAGFHFHWNFNELGLMPTFGIFNFPGPNFEIWDNIFYFKIQIWKKPLIWQSNIPHLIPKISGFLKMATQQLDTVK